MIRTAASVLQRAALCLMLSAATVWAQAQAQPEQAGQAGLERIRNYLATMQDLRAEFGQEVIGPGEEAIEQASGSVTLSKPGRFRWDYREPYERIIVADGERVWFYEADLEQVTIRRLSSGLGDTPAALLTGDVSALENFELLGSRAENGLDWLQLAPVSAEADFATVDLGFDGEEMRRIEFVDRLGQRTRLSLTGIDRTPRLTGDEFHFVIPEGVDVIGEDDM